MSEAQAPVTVSGRSHHLSDHRHVLDGDGSLGPRRCPSFVEVRKFVGRERSSSVLSFNWKEENLLRKKLSFLESMKKYEANAWLREQKAFYKRYQTRLQALELEHARLLGNKDLVRQLTSQNRLLTYTSSMEDQSEAAVKAIIQARFWWEGKTRLGGSAGGDTSLPGPREGLPEPALTPAPPGVTVKADLRKEKWMSAVTVRGSRSRGEHKPALALSFDPLGAPEAGPQPRRVLVDCRPVSTVQSQLPDVDAGRPSKDKVPQYTVWGGRDVEQLRKIQPGRRDSSPCGPMEVQVAKLLLARRRAMLGQDFPVGKGTPCPVDSPQGHPWATRFLRTTLPAAPWERAARKCRVDQGPECTGPREGHVVVEAAQPQT